VLRALSVGIQTPLWDRLPELSMPVAVVAGEKDPKYVSLARRISALLPRGELHIVPDAGHIVHLENRAAFVSILKKILADVY
jgi:pimeloyl-ACP methyl ester carboxylesterase